MTGPGEDSQKHKSEDAAKYLAESFFGLNLNPADVGGEVLFDDYDDAPPAAQAGDSGVPSLKDRDKSVPAFVSAETTSSDITSVPNRFEENLDDLIVFSDDDDEDDQIDDEDDDEEDDENFDFGDEEDDDDDDDDELDDDEDFDEDEEEEDDEEEDELDDEELDFGDDVMDPAPKKVVPAAHQSRGGRESRADASRTGVVRSDRSSADSRGLQRPATGPRGDRPDERSAGRGSRSQESAAARIDSRGSDRPPAAKAADAGRKSPPADDEYWNELDGWVWDDEKKKKPAAASASKSSAIDDDDEDDDDNEITGIAPATTTDDDDDAPKPRRGRRRGGRGRGRGRGRRDEKETVAPVGQASDSPRGNVDFDDDFSEIMFEEDQEDFVSMSADSAKAQRRIKDDPESQNTRQREPDDDDDEDTGDDTERSEAGEGRSSGARRGRRGRRGRGRGREDSREPVRADEGSPTRAQRPARDEDNMDDDLADDDVDLSDFGDQDDENIVPRRREGARSEQAPRNQGRGRGQSDREPRAEESTERPRRQPVRESRPTTAGEEVESRRGPRPARVAAEFQDIPTWEEAIGSLAIRTPSEEHARRAETRGRRDGGRPPRRRN